MSRWLVLDRDEALQAWRLGCPECGRASVQTFERLASLGWPEPYGTPPDAEKPTLACRCGYAAHLPGRTDRERDLAGEFAFEFTNDVPRSPHEWGRAADVSFGFSGTADELLALVQPWASFAAEYRLRTPRPPLRNVLRNVWRAYRRMTRTRDEGVLDVALRDLCDWILGVDTRVRVEIPLARFALSQPTGILKITGV